MRHKADHVEALGKKAAEGGSKLKIGDGEGMKSYGKTVLFLLRRRWWARTINGKHRTYFCSQKQGTLIGGAKRQRQAREQKQSRGAKENFKNHSRNLGKRAP